MEQTKINTQETTLLTMMAELSVRLEHLQADLMKPHSADSSEQVVERENDEVVEQLSFETKDKLAQIKRALVAIKQGNYGVCDQCGEDIAPARLQSIPYVNKCVNCA